MGHWHFSSLVIFSYRLLSELYSSCIKEPILHVNNMDDLVDSNQTSDNDENKCRHAEGLTSDIERDLNHFPPNEYDPLQIYRRAQPLRLLARRVSHRSWRSRRLGTAVERRRDQIWSCWCCWVVRWCEFVYVHHQSVTLVLYTNSVVCLITEERKSNHRHLQQYKDNSQVTVGLLL